MAETPQAADQTAEPRKSGKLVLAGTVAGCLLAGAVGGAFVTGNLPGSSGAGEGVQRAGPPVTRLVNDLVVNPHGTGGSRFLLVDVVFEVSSAAAAAELEQRDAELRDRLHRVLGSKSVAELSDVLERDALGGELRNAVEDLTSGGVVLNVFFPRFVIQ